MRVAIRDSMWWVPPEQAVWVPAGISHEVSVEQAMAMRTLYVHPDAARELLHSCCVVPVRSLLRELIIEASRSFDGYGPATPQARLAAVILDELRRLHPEPLHLPMPRDKRLRVITDGLTAKPTDSRTLEEWSQPAGASARTLARRFREETGITFGRWRQRLRVLSATTRLGAGDPVTMVAYDLGYSSPSAFIATFKRSFGSSPARYFRASNR